VCIIQTVCENTCGSFVREVGNACLFFQVWGHLHSLIYVEAPGVLISRGVVGKGLENPPFVPLLSPKPLVQERLGCVEFRIGGFARYSVSGPYVSRSIANNDTPPFFEAFIDRYGPT